MVILESLPRINTKDVKRLVSGKVEGLTLTLGQIRWPVRYIEEDKTLIIHDQAIKLDFVKSNLEARHSIFFFKCPFTRRRCRTLFIAPLRGSYRIISRYSFKHLYEIQTLSRRQRIVTNNYKLEAELERVFKKKYNKFHYRGKPTVLQKRVDRLEDRLDVWGERLAGKVLTVFDQLALFGYKYK